MKRHLLLPFAAVLVFTACNERIDLKLGDLDDPRLVVEGWITDQPMAHKVRLTMSGNYYANEPAVNVTNAVVTIADGVQTFNLVEEPIGSGNYWTPDDAAGVVGRTYVLTIQVNGQTYTASDMMRPVPPIDSLAVTYDDQQGDLPNDQLPWYEVRVWTHELPGIGDHYRWVNSINGVRNDSLKNSSFVDDELYDGSYVEGVAVGWVRVQPGDVVRTEQMSITAEAYDVCTAVLSETEWRGGPFDPPPSNVPSNLSNGALGFFGACSVTEMTVTVE